MKLKKSVEKRVYTSRLYPACQHCIIRDGLGLSCSCQGDRLLATVSAAGACAVGFAIRRRM